MGKTISNVRLQLLNNTTEGWVSSSFVPMKGEPCLEFDTINNVTKLKFGDGVHIYSELPYASPDLANYITDTMLSEELTDYAKKSEIPSKTSDLINDSNFVTETYVDNKFSSLGTFIHIKGILNTVSELPASGNEEGDLYFVKVSEGHGEYIWLSTNTWELLGTVQISTDLTGYLTKIEANNLYVSKDDDKVLYSTDDLILICGNQE